MNNDIKEIMRNNHYGYVHSKELKEILDETRNYCNCEKIGDQ